MTVVDGIEVEEEFDCFRHPESRLISRENVFVCSGIFFPFIKAGDEVGMNEGLAFLKINNLSCYAELHAIFEHEFYMRGKTSIPIYQSLRREVQYTDDHLVLKLGELLVQTPPPSEQSVLVPP